MAHDIACIFVEGVKFRFRPKSDRGLDIPACKWCSFLMQSSLKRLLIIALLCQLGLAQAPMRYEDVSLSQLLADPGAHAGHRVRVHGFLFLEFEGNAIWADEAAFRADRYDRSLWVSKAKRWSQISGKTAYVSGVFAPDNNGHGGLWAGAIEEVTQIEADPLDRLPARNWRTDPLLALSCALLCVAGIIASMFALAGSGGWSLLRPTHLPAPLRRAVKRP
jgi:hypothetical protein